MSWPAKSGWVPGEPLRTCVPTARSPTARPLGHRLGLDRAEREPDELDDRVVVRRVRHEERIELERKSVQVETAFGAVALKVAIVPGGADRAMPEFESVREVAERCGRHYREVAEAAITAWRGGRNGS